MALCVELPYSSKVKLKKKTLQKLHSCNARPFIANLHELETKYGMHLKELELMDMELKLIEELRWKC